MDRRPSALLVCLLVWGQPMVHAAEAPKPVQGFVLAGQSSMGRQAVADLDGKGTLDARFTDPAMARRVRHLKPVGDALGQGLVALLAAPPEEKPEPAKPTSRTVRQVEGWSVRVDDRLLEGPDAVLGARALRFLEGKLGDIKAVVPEDKLKKLQAVAIVLDLTHAKLGPMQYHPSAGWLKENGYATDLEKCVHIPRAADLPTRRNINEQPWVVLHELAHAYHDQVLGFDEPRIKEAFDAYKKSGHGDKTLLYSGERVRHYALTDHKEFFAEMTEAYFGVNDFFPFNRAELKESEPEIYDLMKRTWESPAQR